MTTKKILREIHAHGHEYYYCGRVFLWYEGATYLVRKKEKEELGKPVLFAPVEEEVQISESDITKFVYDVITTERVEEDV